MFVAHSHWFDVELNTKAVDVHNVHTVFDEQSAQFVMNDEHSEHTATPLSTFPVIQGHVLLLLRCERKLVAPSHVPHFVYNYPVQV